MSTPAEARSRQRPPAVEDDVHSDHEVYCTQCAAHYKKKKLSTRGPESRVCDVCDILQLVTSWSFFSYKSTKGASKLRRDLINSEVAVLRDLLPLPATTRQRMSQLQLMALVCVYVRKANYFQQGGSLERVSSASPERAPRANPRG